MPIFPANASHVAMIVATTAVAHAATHLVGRAIHVVAPVALVVAVVVVAWERAVPVPVVAAAVAVVRDHAAMTAARAEILGRAPSHAPNPRRCQSWKFAFCLTKRASSPWRCRSAARAGRIRSSTSPT